MPAGQKQIQEVAISEIAQNVSTNQVSSIAVDQNQITATLKDGKEISAYKESGASLKDYGITPDKVSINVKNPDRNSFWTSFLSVILPFLLIGGFLYFMLRQAQGGNMKAMSFGQSRARLFAPGSKKTTFADVAGLVEPKQELQEVVEFLKNPAKFKNLGAEIPKGVLLVGPPGCGKCITGDSLVLTNKGLIKIEDIPKYYFVDKKNNVSGAKVVSFNLPKKKNQLQTASHWYNLGLQSTIKIETQLGQSIEGTSEHPIIILNKSGDFQFKRLDQAQEGDYVVVRYNTQQFGRDHTIPDQETAYLLGLLIGDGGLTIKGRISFSTKDSELLSFVANYFKKRFGYILKKTSGKYDWAVHSEEILRTFRSYGLTALYSREKMVPEPILLSPKPIIQAFMQGLFDTDGSFERTRGVVSFSSSSQELLRQTSLLLLNLGVVNRIAKRYKRLPNRNYYFLDISGDFLSVFQEEIGFRLSYKKKFLIEYLSSTGRNTNNNLVYNQHQRISDIWLYLKKSTQVYKIFKENQYKNILRYIDGTRQPSLSAMRNFLTMAREIAPNVKQLTSYQYLSGLCFSGFFFTPVMKIKKGKNVVYDFTVPKTHSFISNGMISHNTLMAKAVAGEANVPFFSISASEFVEMFVGVGAARVRDLFQKTKRNAPAILFIDELDAIGRQRGSGLGGSHDEREQTLNQILVEMDGFETDTRAIVMAATNRPDVLDPALLRPGRFDRRVMVDLPDLNEREAILKIHSRSKPLSKTADLVKLARSTAGLSGADLRNVMNEAAILAARGSLKEIRQEELNSSIEKVILGPERKSHLLSDKEREISAFHEIGHVIVGKSLPNCDPIHKVSIVSRGMALGYTWSLPIEDRKLQSKAKFEDEVAQLLGGYVAEKIVFGQVTTGAQNDLKRATQIARDMVMVYGMSDKLGPIVLGEKEEMIFLGREISEQRNYSESKAFQIDNEVAKIITDAQKVATKVLMGKRAVLKKLAEKLIKLETIEGDDIKI